MRTRIDVVARQLGGPPEQPGWPAVSSPRAARLRATWHRRSLQGSWASAGDWWHPACDALVEALVVGLDARPCVRRLGRARSHLGVPIEETMDDVSALWEVFARDEPPAAVLRAVAAGWAEAGLEPAGAASCFDAITGLATRAHLEARLSELYRAGELGGPVPQRQLVVLDVGFIPELVSAEEVAWRQLDVVCRCAEAMRRVFTTGQQLARLAPARLGALARTGPDLARHITDLESMLAAAELPDIAPVIWVEALPRTYGLVPALLADLAR
ncbi:MAG TPA: hypothetical protein VFX33_02855 [Actinomycetales bacterium]|nr:hypothetical protein [Actinomycetales bacterium]